MSCRSGSSVWHCMPVDSRGQGLLELGCHARDTGHLKIYSLLLRIAILTTRPLSVLSPAIITDCHHDAC